MNLYAKFTEHNEQEGETWRFWIPIDGNEKALDRLNAAIDAADPEEYELDLTPVPEVEVDVLVKHTGDCGYMDRDIKLAGVLTGMMRSTTEDGEGDEHPLYKGGIKDLMTS